MSDRTGSGALPAAFLDHLADLERAYLAETDPARQSGFRGGAERWRAERSPILDALPGSCDFLDIGCANGYLLECLLHWSQARGVTLVPFGLDCGAGLVQLARARLPQYAEHFYVGNAWDWQPPRPFACVYSVLDCVPPEYFGDYVRRLLACFVAPRGRLIIGAYGNRSRGEPPAPVAALLTQLGLTLTGATSAGEPVTARFAWVHRESP
jgi:SAM-dependent methyltransferase